LLRYRSQYFVELLRIGEYYLAHLSRNLVAQYYWFVLKNRPPLNFPDYLEYSRLQEVPKN
jgi:hypothetical protein